MIDETLAASRRDSPKCSNVQGAKSIKNLGADMADIQQWRHRNHKKKYVYIISLWTMSFIAVSRNTNTKNTYTCIFANIHTYIHIWSTYIHKYAHMIRKVFLHTHTQFLHTFLCVYSSVTFFFAHWFCFREERAGTCHGGLGDESSTRGAVTWLGQSTMDLRVTMGILNGVTL